MFISKKKLEKIEKKLENNQLWIDELVKTNKAFHDKLSSQKEIIDLLAKNAGVEFERYEGVPFNLYCNNFVHECRCDKLIKQRLILKKIKK